MVWINEFHYDNQGTDAGEFIEIAGPAGTNLTGYSIVLYNGNPTQRNAYNTTTLSGVIPDQGNGFGTLRFAYPPNGIQNGGTTTAEPDGIALVGPNGLVEFISYEGRFVAASGPAADVESVDVGVSEAGNATGTSIGRIGTGDDAGDFTWALLDDDTPGTVNVGQSFAAAAQPTLSIADLVVDEAAGTATLTVTLSAPASGAVTVDYATADADATVGADYAATAGTLSIPAGETSGTFTVAITNDATDDDGEAFTVTLANPTGGTIADGSATVSITDDDAAAPPPPPLSEPFINEFHYDNAGADAGEFVEIAGAAGTDLTGWKIVLYNANGGASYNTRDLSGVIGAQNNGFGTISFAYPPNGLQNGGTATPEPDGLALVRPDGSVAEFISYEGVFTATNGPAQGLTSTDVGVAERGDATGTSIGRVGQGTRGGDFAWQLLTDDTPGGVNTGQTLGTPQPNVSVGDVSVAETDDGRTFASFTLTRSGPEGAFTVAYATANGTATAGQDYAAASGSVAFAADQRTATVTVEVIGDDAVEFDETFFLDLSNASGANIVDGRGQATIVSDEQPSVVSIGDVAVLEGDAGATRVVFTVTRSSGEGAFSVDYATIAGGTATAGEDYALTNGRIDFAAGETVKTIAVDVIGDTVEEAAETFRVQLFNPTNNAQIADSEAVGTIGNDDNIRFIHDIQGGSYYSPILAGDGISAFNTASTTVVTVRAVVTALDGDGARQGFYLTDERTDWDASLTTSEGIFVMTRTDANAGRALAEAYPNLKVGDLVTVSARVMEYQTFQNLPRTMLVDPGLVVVGASGQALPMLTLDASVDVPSAILTDVRPDYFDSIDGADDSFDASRYALSFFEGLEGMLVTVPDMVVADGAVSTSGGQPFLKAYSTVHADSDQINSRGGYTIAGDPPSALLDTAETEDDVQAGGRFLHDGDVNPDIFEVDFSDFAIDAPAGLTANVTMGDRLGDVTGILDFDFTDLKLFVTNIDAAAITDAQPEQEVTALGGDARALTVATFNVENLDPTDVTAAQTAAKQGKFYDLARAIVANLNSPDILSIEEIQDNNGAAQGGVTVNGVTLSAADASMTWEMLVAALNDVSGRRYQWVDQEPVTNREGGEPGGNIRVGFLYNTNRVQLGDLAPDASIEERRRFTDRIGDGARDAGDRIAFSDAQVQIDLEAWSGTRKSLLGEFTFNGNTVFAVANHLPAKGGSGQFWQLNQNVDAGQPVNSGWDDRSRIGEDLFDVLNLIQQGAPEAGVVSGGDYNEFHFYRAMEAATGYTYADGRARTDGARFDNLTVTELAEAERYTYVFDGRSQAIDHIIANQRLSAVAEYDVVHINTGYNNRGTGAGADPSLSDHDPALAQFDFRSFGETLRGTEAGELIDGFGGNDRLSGLGGDDTLQGGEGDDTLVGGAGDDVLDGGAGLDTVSYADAGRAVNVRLDLRPRETGEGVDSYVSIERVVGSAFADTIYGATADETLQGGAGDDRISAGSGDDLIIGGAGRDAMTGGGGADTFRFEALSDFATGTALDTVGDFSRADSDKLDLSALGDLSFVGRAEFSGSGRGEVRYTAGNSASVQIDVDGDGTADAGFRVSGRVLLVESDFIL